LNLRNVETDITFSLHPIILLFPVASAQKLKIPNSAVRAQSRFPQGRGTGMAFLDERNVFTAARGVT